MSRMQNAQAPNCPELDCSQAGGDQGGGEIGAGVGAGTDEVEVVVARVPVVGAEIGWWRTDACTGCAEAVGREIEQ